MSANVVTPAELERIHAKLGNTASCLRAAIGRVFVASPEGGAWQDAQCWGAVCLVIDRSRNAKLLRVYHLETYEVLLDEELYVGMAYEAPRPFFHTFEVEGAVVGLDFCNEEDAKAFYHRVVSMIPQMKTPLGLTQPTGAGITPQGTATSIGSSMQKRKKSGFFSGVKKLFGSSQDGAFAPMQISGPTNVVHQQHIGFSEAGFEINNVPDEWKALFKQAGVKPRDLKNKETAMLVMETIKNSQAAQHQMAAFRQHRPQAGNDGAQYERARRPDEAHQSDHRQPHRPNDRHQAHPTQAQYDQKQQFSEQQQRQAYEQQKRYDEQRRYEEQQRKYEEEKRRQENDQQKYYGASYQQPQFADQQGYSDQYSVQLQPPIATRPAAQSRQPTRAAPPLPPTRARPEPPVTRGNQPVAIPISPVVHSSALYRMPDAEYAQEVQGSYAESSYVMEEKNQPDENPAFRPPLASSFGQPSEYAQSKPIPAVAPSLFLPESPPAPNRFARPAEVPAVPESPDDRNGLLSAIRNFTPNQLRSADSPIPDLNNVNETDKSDMVSQLRNIIQTRRNFVAEEAVDDDDDDDWD